MNYYQLQQSRKKLIVVLGLLFIFSSSVFCQTSEIVITQEYKNLTWVDFVKKVEREHNVRFFFEKINIPSFNISIISSSSSLKEVLVDNLNQFNITVSIDQSRNIFLTKNAPILTNLPPDFFKSRETKIESNLDTNANVNKADSGFLKTATEYIPKTILIGTKEKGVHKTNVIVSGYAKNIKTGEVIIGTSILDKDSGTGVTTDNSGYFQLVLNKGIHILIINSVSIKEKKIEVNVLSEGNLDLLLEDEIYLLEDVIISARKNNKVQGTSMGIEKITAKSVKNIPLVFGEKDIVKVALLLPGVQTVGEGSAGFNVRGSPTDQNLFYINNIPIYNTSHASGFFSSFNADAISDFTLYKSNIPVQYGGRLSSIFDIKSKQGNKENTTASGGISFITGRVLVEGPIKKNKSSFLVGIRSTYSDWIIDMMFKDQDIKDSNANFADAVTNFTFQIDDKNLLNIFSYASYDKMNLVATKTQYNYVNLGSSINWKHIFNKRHTFELSLAHSIYDFNKEETVNDYTAFKQDYRLEHSEVKANFTLKPNNGHTITAGINSTLYRINRGSKLPLTDISLIEELHLGTEKGLESGVYISDEWELTPKISLNAGIRYNLYASLGPQKVFKYADGLPKIERNIEDTLSFANNKIAKSYGGLDFRLAAKYSISKEASVKLSFNRLHQYIFMLSNTVAISPDYTWKLVDYNTKPMVGDQFSLGFFSNIASNAYEVSAEIYYKNITNLVEIKDGEDLLQSKYIEQSTLQGSMKAYGVELMLKKNFGDLTGWINYTYSNTSVLVNSEFFENRINNGRSYPSNYDKPHAVNLVANYNFSRRFRMSGNVVYSTGRPITYPTSLYYLDGIKTINYSKRNEYRIPDYFRIDVSLTLEGNLRKNKVAHSSWTFSIYNVLGTNNPYSIYFEQKENQIKGYKLSIFAAPILSLTYNFKLGNYAN